MCRPASHRDAVRCTARAPATARHSSGRPAVHPPESSACSVRFASPSAPRHRRGDRHRPRRTLSVALAAPVGAQTPALKALHTAIDNHAVEIETKVVAWRRDIHQHPELSFQEVRTAKLVADHLKSLGLEVQHRRRRERGRRGAARWKAGAGRGAARRHGRPPGHRTRRPPLQEHRARGLQRAGDRRHARLRTRQPRRHPHGERRKSSPR
jgi:hypothetical protein